MVVTSAGILLYRQAEEDARTPRGTPEVLIAHMGGPFWAAKDTGAWSIPKGEYHPDSEVALEAALREFSEELGVPAPEGPYAELGTFAYSSGKRVTVFVADGAGFSVEGLAFGEFTMQWPPGSGRMQSFPEVDRVEWITMDAARERLVKGQRPALHALERRLAEADV